MARNRMIKSDFFNDEKIGSFSVVARLLFIGLWVYSDDGGVCRGNPIYLRNNIFPYDDISINDITVALQELSSSGVVTLLHYREENYIKIENFLKHQTINKPSKFRFIENEGECSSGVVVVDNHYRLKEKEKEKEKENDNDMRQCSSSVVVVQEPSKEKKKNKKLDETLASVSREISDVPSELQTESSSLSFLENVLEEIQLVEDPVEFFKANKQALEAVAEFYTQIQAKNKNGTRGSVNDPKKYKRGVIRGLTGQEDWDVSNAIDAVVDGAKSRREGLLMRIEKLNESRKSDVSLKIESDARKSAMAAFENMPESEREKIREEAVRAVTGQMPNVNVDPNSGFVKREICNIISSRESDVISVLN